MKEEIIKNIKTIISRREEMIKRPGLSESFRRNLEYEISGLKTALLIVYETKGE